MLKVLVFVALCGLLAFLFLRPDPSAPAVTAPTAPGLSGFEAKLLATWARHSGTWKRWIVALAAFALGFFFSWFVS